MRPRRAGEFAAVVKKDTSEVVSKTEQRILEKTHDLLGPVGAAASKAVPGLAGGARAASGARAAGRNERTSPKVAAATPPFHATLFTRARSPACVRPASARPFMDEIRDPGVPCPYDEILSTR